MEIAKGVTRGDNDALSVGLFDKIKTARTKMEKGEGGGSNGGLASLDFDLPDEKKIAEVVEDGKLKKGWAEAAAPKLLDIQKGMAQLFAKEAALISEEGQRMYAELEHAREAILSSGGPGVQDHLHFCVLCELVRRTDSRGPETVKGMLNYLVAAERFSLKGNKKDPGPVFFQGKRYYSLLEEDRSLSKGQKLLVDLVWRKINKLDQDIGKRLKSFSSANHDLTGLLEKKVGRYYLYVPSENGDKGGRKRSEGHLIVNLRVSRGSLGIYFVGAAGCFTFLGHPAKDHFERRIPYFWFEKGGVIAKGLDKIPDAEYSLYKGMVRSLCEGVEYWKESRRSKNQPSVEAELEATTTTAAE